MRTLTLLIKPVSGNCNMRCKYCFYTEVGDLRKVKSRGVMTRETLETLMRKAFDEAEGAVHITFQGGEPTLAGLDFYRYAVELEKQYNRRGVAVSYAIQTNGMAINEEWAAFLAEHRFLVGLSIDGTETTHDQARLGPAGEPTHRRCLKAARILHKAGAQFNILTVVTDAVARHPDSTYRFYKQRGFDFVQFIPCLGRLDAVDEDDVYALVPEAYGQFLCRIFDLWYEDFAAGRYISVRMFDNLVYMLAGYPPESCAMNGHCTAYALVEADGDVYPCDFYALDEQLLGNITRNSFAEMLASERAKAFVKPSLALHKDCVDCIYAGICRGGCRRDREPMTDAGLSQNRFCEAYKRFYAHALPRLQRIASAQLQQKRG